MFVCPKIRFIDVKSLAKFSLRTRSLRSRSTKAKFRQRFNVYKSYFRTYKQKRLSGNFHTGKPVPQASFFSHSFEQDHRGEFSVKISIIDGAGDVYSLRRKELFWQYKLGVFSPKGLNERVADIELDLFACGSA